MVNAILKLNAAMRGPFTYVWEAERNSLVAIQYAVSFKSHAHTCTPRHEPTQGIAIKPQLLDRGTLGRCRLAPGVPQRPAADRTQCGNSRIAGNSPVQSQVQDRSTHNGTSPTDG